MTIRGELWRVLHHDTSNAHPHHKLSEARRKASRAFPGQRVIAFYARDPGVTEFEGLPVLPDARYPVGYVWALVDVLAHEQPSLFGG